MHTLTNFKGFADARVDLFRPLSVLIGPNGVGKTNLLEAIELLAFLASGNPLHNVTDVGRGGSLELRGGLQSCPRHPGEEFELGFTAGIEFDGQSQQVEYRLAVGVAPTPAIRRERLTLGERTLFSATANAPSPDLLDVVYDNFNRGPNKPRTQCPATSTVLARYESLASSNKRLTELSAIVRSLGRHLQRAYVFDPSPRLMRDYDRIGNNVLLRDGSNLSSVLYALSTGTAEQQATLARILECIRQLPEEPFDAFGFETTRLQDVLFGFKRAGSSSLVDARLLSDGTLRSLAVLTAAETCPPRSRVVVEEFDNGVHPSRVSVLAGALFETSQRRNLNVLVTTHNPATLDALTPEQLDGVLVCHWDKRADVAAVTPLKDLPRADELLARGRLGDLVTRRVLETYLTSNAEEERKRATQQWLEGLPS